MKKIKSFWTTLTLAALLGLGTPLGFSGCSEGPDDVTIRLSANDQALVQFTLALVFLGNNFLELAEFIPLPTLKASEISTSECVNGGTFTQDPNTNTVSFDNCSLLQGEILNGDMLLQRFSPDNRSGLITLKNFSGIQNGVGFQSAGDITQDDLGDQIDFDVDLNHFVTGQDGQVGQAQATGEPNISGPGDLGGDLFFESEGGVTDNFFCDFAGTNASNLLEDPTILNSICVGF